MRARIALLFLVMLGLQARAQPPVSSATLQLRFIPAISGRPLALSGESGDVPKDSLRITALRCYISGVSLWLAGKRVWEEDQGYHLLDASVPESLRMQLRPPAGLAYTTLRFNLGIDSATSASGAHGGELDPARGMYWAWQSGYINFKLEGASPLCMTRKHEFHFHLGGYRYPYAAMQPVSLDVKAAAELSVIMDVNSFLSGIDLAKQHDVMIPGEEAAELSQKAIRIFHAQP